MDLLPGYLVQMERVLRAASGIRRAGSAALDLAYVAQGSLDAFWEETLMPWDFAAGVVLIREAGGIVTGPDGAPPALADTPLRAANSPALLAALEEALAG